MGTRIKKIIMSNYLNKQTAYQIGSIWEAFGYKIIYVF